MGILSAVSNYEFKQTLYHDAGHPLFAFIQVISAIDLYLVDFVRLVTPLINLRLRWDHPSSQLDPVAKIGFRLDKVLGKRFLN